MITANQFALDLRDRLDVRQELRLEINSLASFGPSGETPEAPEAIMKLNARTDDYIQDYWTSSMLSLTEEIGDTRKRPLDESDIPAVAASMCIQFLMAGAFPDFDDNHAQNLQFGSRANPEAGEIVEIDVLEPAAITWLQNALEFGKIAESGKPTIISVGTTQFTHVTKRPQIEVVTKHKDGEFFCIQTRLTSGTSMAASRQKGDAIPKFNFSFAPPAAVTIGTMKPLQNVSTQYEKTAREILGRISGDTKPISLDELFVLTIAKQTGLVKKLPKEPIKVAIAQNRKLCTQDADSFKQLTGAASQAGIKLSFTHPMPHPRTRINGRTV